MSPTDWLFRLIRRFHQSNLDRVFPMPTYPAHFLAGDSVAYKGKWVKVDRSMTLNSEAELARYVDERLD
jgi:hypothetical protein